MKMKKIRKVMDSVLGTMCSVMLSLMTILAVYQVVSRYCLLYTSRCV